MSKHTEPAAGSGHEWVGATLVGMGRGETARAEHAARTGRHVLPERTKVEVLEVYCRRCRVGYTMASSRAACPLVAAPSRAA